MVYRSTGLKPNVYSCGLQIRIPIVYSWYTEVYRYTGIQVYRYTVSVYHKYTVRKPYTVYSLQCIQSIQVVYSYYHGTRYTVVSRSTAIPLDYARLEGDASRPGEQAEQAAARDLGLWIPRLTAGSSSPWQSASDGCLLRCPATSRREPGPWQTSPLAIGRGTRPPPP